MENEIKLTSDEKILYERAKKINPNLTREDFLLRREKALERSNLRPIVVIQIGGTIIIGNNSSSLVDQDQLKESFKEDDDNRK